MALIKICPNCDRRNVGDAQVCAFCDMALNTTRPFEAPALSPPRISINGTFLDLPYQVELTIGRASENTISLPDINLTSFGGDAAAGVSRRHARLVWNGVWQIEDLESANGTIVNNKRLFTKQVLTLPPNSVIQIGKMYLVFHG
jgi:pSer/pThr/pTyr-binding forkhead associated (FHA) protein